MTTALEKAQKLLSIVNKITKLQNEYAIVRSEIDQLVYGNVVPMGSSIANVPVETKVAREIAPEDPFKAITSIRPKEEVAARKQEIVRKAEKNKANPPKRMLLRQKDVLAAFTNGLPETVASLVKTIHGCGIDCSDASVMMHLYRALQSGRVTKTKDGRYQLVKEA